jgi:hypothetical protein
MPDDVDAHTEGTPRGEDMADPPTETKGDTDRPVGQVEGDLMEPNESGSGTSSV